MPLGKSVRRKAIPTLKAEHRPEVRPVIRETQPWVRNKRKVNTEERIPIRLSIRIQRGVTVNRKAHKAHRQQVLHHRISTATALILRMDRRVDLPIRQQLATIISRPIRHLRPTTVVDERAHLHPVQFFVFVFPRSSPWPHLLCFVVLSYSYLYHFL